MTILGGPVPADDGALAAAAVAAAPAALAAWFANAIMRAVDGLRADKGDAFDGEMPVSFTRVRDEETDDEDDRRRDPGGGRRAVVEVG